MTDQPDSREVERVARAIQFQLAAFEQDVRVSDLLPSEVRSLATAALATTGARVAELGACQILLAYIAAIWSRVICGITAWSSSIVKDRAMPIDKENDNVK